MFNASLIDVPRPYLDPISSLMEALSVACLAVSRPQRNSTIALLLNSRNMGIGMHLYGPLTHEVVHHIVGDASQLTDVSSVVLVSTRTTSPAQQEDPALLQFMNMVFQNSGLTMFDWVVLGRGGLYCPRSLLNQPDPWPCSAINL